MVRWVDTFFEAPLDWVLDGLQKKVPGFEDFGGIHNALLYETPQVTRIRDAKLGMIYYSLLCCIFTYVVYNIGDRSTYLERGTPLQWAQVQARMPIKAHTCEGEHTEVSTAGNNGCQHNFRGIDELDYCCSDTCDKFNEVKDWEGRDKPGSCLCPRKADEVIPGGEVMNTGNFLDASGSSTADAETEESRPGSMVGKVRSYPCIFLEPLTATETKAGAIFLSTFTKFWREHINPKCNLDSGECDVLWMNMDGVGNSSHAFVADIEHYRLSVAHSVTSQMHGFTLTSNEMTGYLMVGSDDGQEPAISQHRLCRERDDAVDAPWQGNPTDRAPCYIKPAVNEDGDEFEFELLLQALGLDLNMPSSNFHKADPEMTLREQGFTVHLVIVYFNTWPWQGLIGGVRYYYQPQARPRLKYARTTYSLIDRLDEPGGDPEAFSFQHPEAYRYERISKLSSGIFLRVSADGVLGLFSWHRLTLELATALMLMGVATQCITLVARFLLRWSGYYTMMIYDTSGDFGRLFEISQMSDEELAMKLQKKGISSVGKRTREESELLLLQSEDAALHHAKHHAIDTRASQQSTSSRKASPQQSIAVHKDVQVKDVDADESSESIPLISMDVERGSSQAAPRNAEASTSRASYGSANGEHF